MIKRRSSLLFACCLAGFFAVPGSAIATDRVHTIARVKPSVVAIATWDKTRVPPMNFIGSGFIVGNGLTVITNAHVAQVAGVNDQAEQLGIIVGDHGAANFRQAKLTASDTEHDIAKLTITGTPLPALELGDSDSVQEGQKLLFTGFPLGMILGFHHATHQAMVSAITPIAIPTSNSRGLNAKTVKRLRDAPYFVFQLDGTAYPGNSGSPLYDPETGKVYGIVNKVFVKGTKEAAISAPSGISYAIPGKFIVELLGMTK